MSLRPRGAPLARLRPLSPEQLRARQAEIQQGGGYQPLPGEDPRTTVQAMIDEVPQVEVLDVQRGRDLIRDSNVLEDMSEVPQAFGSSFAAQPRSEIMLDVDQNPVRDDEGNIVTRPYDVADYTNQLGIERESQADVSNAIYDLANRQDPNADLTSLDSPSEILERAMHSRQYAAIGGNVREEAETRDWNDNYIRKYADKGGMPLTVAIRDSYNALFQEDSRAKVSDGQGGLLPVGTHALNQLGMLENPDTPALVATLGAVAFNRAITQIPQYNKNKQERLEVPKDRNGFAVDDAQYLSDFISSIRHFLNNGLRNVNLEAAIPREYQEALAKALAMDAINRGTVMPVHTNADPRPIIVGTPGIKGRARQLQLAAETLAGDTLMARSLTVPARSGGSFASGGQRMTSRSLRVDDMVTQAAELTKDILGSVATQYRVKDLKFTEIMIDLVLAKDQLQLDSESKRFMWSNHPAAERYGLAEGNYLAARNKHEPPHDYNPDDPKQVNDYKRAAVEAALTVMGMERDKVKLSLDAIKGSPGARYTQYMHSIANQRFFPASFDTDHVGNKNVIRDTISLIKQDICRPVDFFVTEGVYRVKYLAKNIFRNVGEKQYNDFTALAPTERGALGTMYSAVVFYYSALEPGKYNITKMAPRDVINLYTVDIGNRLAAMGQQYNDFLADPANATQEIKDFLFSMERGESIGAKNLVDDFFQMRSARDNYYKSSTFVPGNADWQRDTTHVPMTHHVFDDGNQNGIFLQSLFFGSDPNSRSYAASGAVTVRLGTADASLEDMRTYFMNVTFDNLDDILSQDNEERAAGWRSFVNAAIEAVGADKFAKDFFKSPLMQAAYGKDASMFTDLLYEVLFDNPKYTKLIDEHLLATKLYKTNGEVATDLSTAVELGLREVLDTNGTFIMKRVGRFMAILGKSIMLPGPSGDTSVFTPVGTVLRNKEGSSNVVVQSTVRGNGRAIKLSRPRASDDPLVDPPTGAEVSLPSAELGYMPQATRGVQMIFNRVAQRYTAFGNAIGTWMSRAFAVLPIQAIDGDLVKWSTIFANRNRTVPEPVLWVHDSSISTPSASLLYRNVYNNIAIPRAIPQIAKFGKRLAKFVNDSKRELFQDLRERGMGSVIGIGNQGEFAALGALFDEVNERFVINEGRDERTNRLPGKQNARKEENRLARVQKAKELIKQAYAAGWIPKEQLSDVQAKYIGVNPSQLFALINLAEGWLQLDGPSNIFSEWAKNFEATTMRAGTLLNSSKGRAGIWQLSPTGVAPIKHTAVKQPQSKAKEVNDPNQTAFGGDNIVASPLLKGENEVTKVLKQMDQGAPAFYERKRKRDAELQAARKQSKRRLQEVGWDDDWPLSPSELSDRSLRQFIKGNDDFTRDEKERMFAAAKKLGFIPPDIDPWNE